MSRPIPWKYLLKVQLPIMVAVLAVVGLVGKQPIAGIATTGVLTVMVFLLFMIVLVKFGYDPSKQRERQAAIAAERRRVADEKRAAKAEASGKTTKSSKGRSASGKPKVAPTSRTNAGNKRPGR
jgi:hypothetical protein